MPTRFLLWGIAFILCANAQAALPQGCSDQELKLAEKSEKSISKLFASGLVKAEDVQAMRQTLLDVQVCAGVITGAQYCQKKEANVAALVKKLDALMQAGKTDLALTKRVYAALLWQRRSCQ